MPLTKRRFFCWSTCRMPLSGNNSWHQNEDFCRNYETFQTWLFVHIECIFSCSPPHRGNMVFQNSGDFHVSGATEVCEKRHLRKGTYAFQKRCLTFLLSSVTHFTIKESSGKFASNHLHCYYLPLFFAFGKLHLCRLICDLWENCTNCRNELAKVNTAVIRLLVRCSQCPNLFVKII